MNINIVMLVKNKSQVWIEVILCFGEQISEIHCICFVILLIWLTWSVLYSVNLASTCPFTQSWWLETGKVYYSHSCSSGSSMDNTFDVLCNVMN